MDEGVAGDDKVRSVLTSLDYHPDSTHTLSLPPTHIVPTHLTSFPTPTTILNFSNWETITRPGGRQGRARGARGESQAMDRHDTTQHDMKDAQ
jgi:hypothetical protein